MEKIDPFFSKLNKMFATNFRFTGKALNVNENAHQTNDDITPEAEEIIQSMIKYDVMIYEAAKTLWDA
jgi:p-aminobenzoyl-glutamate transporter AbgT